MMTEDSFHGIKRHLNSKLQEANGFHCSADRSAAVINWSRMVASATAVRVVSAISWLRLVN